MKLRYETAITTFIQLALMSFLIIVGGVIDTIKECQDGARSCLASSFLWLVMLIFGASFFVFLSALGYFAQAKRSRRLAILLIFAELGVAGICFKLLTNPSSVLSGLGSFAMLGLALWTIVLAYRLMQAKGGRIVAKPRASAIRPRRSKIPR